MVTYVGKVLSLDPDIEEKVTLEVNGLVITCFADICPYSIKIGEKYPITFDMLDFQVSIQEGTEETNIKRIGTSCSYELRGRLYQGIIDAGICVSDDFLKSDYAYLDKAYICLLVERLDVEFLC